MAAALESIFGKQLLNKLNSEYPTPLYFQLFTLLKGMILDGTFAYGDSIPTEKDLAVAFNVSRITAKRSMDELANEGLIERRRGVGSHVTYKYVPKPVRAPLEGMLQEIESMARNSQATILECAMLKPPRSIRDEFELGSEEQALHLRRVRERNGLKFGYYNSWTTGVDLPSNPELFETEPRLSYFRSNGLVITHVTQTISATAATDETAQVMDMVPGAPLLTLTRRSFNKVDDKEHLIDYLYVLYNPEHFQYKMDLKID